MTLGRLRTGARKAAYSKGRVAAGEKSRPRVDRLAALAGDATEDNLGPVGRVAYAFSTMACVPVSLSQEVGMALGAQAGQAKLTEVIKAGGFSKVHRAAETRVNMVLEARP